MLIGNVDIGNTLVVGLNVAQVADVAFLVSWATVRFSLRIEVSTSRGAAVGVVAKLVDCK